MLSIKTIGGLKWRHGPQLHIAEQLYVWHPDFVFTFSVSADDLVSYSAWN